MTRTGTPQGDCAGLAAPGGSRVLVDTCALTVPGPFLRIAGGERGLWIDQLDVTVARADAQSSSGATPTSWVVEATAQPLWMTTVHLHGGSSAMEALSLRRSHAYATGAEHPRSGLLV